MSETRPKRAPRESRRGINATAAGTGIAGPVEIDPASVPETATAAVALATAAAAEPIAETAADPIAEAVAASPQAPGDATPAGEDQWADPWSTWTEAQSALVRGFEAATTEVSELTRSGIAATTEAATAMLGAKTFAQAIEINADFARRGFDVMLGGAARLSEIGVKAATDVSRPILNHLGESWKGLNGH